MALGFQDPWVSGTRFLFKRENQGATQFPLIDLGAMDPVGPTLTVTKIEAKDGGTGRLKTLDERVTDFVEEYTITCRNLSVENLAILYLANRPSSVTQNANTTKTIPTSPSTVFIKMFKGELVKLHDDDTARSLLYNFDAIGGLYNGTVAFATLTAISRSAKTLTVTGDITASLTPNDSVIVDRTGLANAKNSRSYKIVSSSFGGGNTTIVVADTPASDETAISDQVVYENGGLIYNQGTDWLPYRVDHGIIQITAGSAIADGATNVTVRSSLAAYSGARQIKPKSAAGEIRGDGFFIFARGNNAEVTYREARVAIRPASAAIGVDDYSTVSFTVKVLTTLGAEQPAGRLVQAIGAVPTNS